MFLAKLQAGAIQSNIRSAVNFILQLYENDYNLGMPHIHILLILEKKGQIITSADVDRYISARIPPLPSQNDTTPAADQQRRLWNYVTTMMLHSCNKVCLETKDVGGLPKVVCRKNFPKPYSDNTEISGRI